MPATHSDKTISIFKGYINWQIIELFMEVADIILLSNLLEFHLFADTKSAKDGFID